MPKLPTIRVIGSHAISTRPFSSSVNFLTTIALPPDLLVAGGQVAARGAPFRFVVQCVRRDPTEPPDRIAVQAAGQGRDAGPGRFVHERHKLVGEAGHGAPDADAAHVGAAPDAVDPPALGHIALHHRAPAAQLDDALGRPVLLGEVALLVVAGAIAALVDGGPEQPLRAE